MVERDVTTQILRQAAEGSPAAADELFAVCYQELRQLAHRCLASEWSEQSLQTTELVHEAYIRLVDAPQLDGRNRAHFFAIAARVMRRILVDHARSRHAAKRGGKARRIHLDDTVTVPVAPSGPDIVAIDLALSRLQEEMPEKARVFEMRFFGGMTSDEISSVLCVSTRTVRRHSAYAQARMYELMQDST